MYEIGSKSKTYIGKIQEALDRPTIAQVEVFYRTLVELPYSESNEFWDNSGLMASLDIIKSEKYRTHWAVKTGNLLAAFEKAGILSRDEIRKIKASLGTNTNNQAKTSTTAINTKAQVRKLLEDPMRSAQDAKAYAEVIRNIISVYTQSTGANQLPDEWLFLKEMETAFEMISDSLSSNKNDRIQKLEEQIGELKSRIRELENKLQERDENSPVAIFKREGAASLGKTLGPAVLVMLIAGLGNIVGLSPEHIGLFIESVTKR